MPVHYVTTAAINKFLDHLPYCETDQEAKCYVDMFVKARKLGVTRKPCVKLQYKAETTTETVSVEKVAEYKLTFSDPPKVTVREEYLIFDGITMISAIGGTLGLCIGFSFKDLFRDVGSSVVQAVSRIIRHKKERVTKNQMTSQFQKTGHLQLETYNPEKIATQGDLAAIKLYGIKTYFIVDGCWVRCNIFNNGTLMPFNDIMDGRKKVEQSIREHQ